MAERGITSAEALTRRRGGQWPPAAEDGSEEAGRVVALTSRRDASRGRRATRPPLPSGRAALGALLVVGAAVGAYVTASSRSHPPTTKYAVASRDIDPGATLSAPDIRLVAMDLPPLLAARALTNPLDLLGATTFGPLRAGELVQTGNITSKPAGPGSREISLAVDPAQAAGGRVRPGDRVDVIATFGSGTDAETRLVAGGVLVIRAERHEVGLSSGRGTLTLTLAVHDVASEVGLAHAVAVGKLALVRTTGAAAAAASGAAQPEAAPAPTPTVGDAQR